MSKIVVGPDGIANITKKAKALRGPILLYDFKAYNTRKWGKEILQKTKPTKPNIPYIWHFRLLYLRNRYIL